MISGRLSHDVCAAVSGMISRAERLHIEGLLSRAGDAARDIGRTSTRPGNHAGALAISSVADAARGEELLLVTKHVQGRAEVAASRLSALLGIDHLVPIATPAGDDSVRMVFAAGQSADAAGIQSAADLIAVREAGLARRAPHVDAATRSRVARMEVELGQVFDYLLANSDRRARNLIVDTENGTFALIDNASIGHGTMFSRKTPTLPTLKPLIQGAGGHTQLSTDTVAWLREHLDEPALRAWHAEHVDAIGGSADDFVARLNHVLEHGSFDYQDSAKLMDLQRNTVSMKSFHR